MTREEAIEVYNGLINEKIKAAFEFFAPELRESEDERIRKALIELLKEVEEDDTYTGRQHIPEMLAYLEKQKEQKPNIELIQRSWYMEGYHDREFGKEPKWIIKTGEGGPKHELNPKYGQPLADGQKPVDHCSVRDEFDLDGNLKQKPAEWSEEDKNMWTHLNGYLNGFSCSEDAIKQMADWFYELPNRFNLQPTQEWGEEDEKMLKSAIWHISNSVTNGKNTDCKCDLTEWFMKRLKSLRPITKK